MVLMIINLSPQRRGESIVVSVEGDVITVNGEEYDFGQVGEGDLLPVKATPDLFVSDITRTNGAIVLTLLFPTPANATQAQNFPEPINQSEGEVELP